MLDFSRIHNKERNDDLTDALDDDCGAESPETSNARSSRCENGDVVDEEPTVSLSQERKSRWDSDRGQSGGVDDLEGAEVHADPAEALTEDFEGLDGYAIVNRTRKGSKSPILESNFTDPHGIPEFSYYNPPAMNRPSNVTITNLAELFPLVASGFVSGQAFLKMWVFDTRTLLSYLQQHNGRLPECFDPPSVTLWNGRRRTVTESLFVRVFDGHNAAGRRRLFFELNLKTWNPPHGIMFYPLSLGQLHGTVTHRQGEKYKGLMSLSLDKIHYNPSRGHWVADSSNKKDDQFDAQSRMMAQQIYNLVKFMLTRFRLMSMDEYIDFARLGR